MKNIFISGASSGIGKSMARSYSKKGCTIGLCSRNIKKLNLVKEECEKLGGKIFIYQLDVQNSQKCIEISKKFNLEAGGVDCVIANAGIGGDDGLFSGNSQKSRIEPNKAAPTIKNGINLIINLPTSFYYLPC